MCRGALGCMSMPHCRVHGSAVEEAGPTKYVQRAESRVCSMCRVCRLCHAGRQAGRQAREQPTTGTNHTVAPHAPRPRRCLFTFFTLFSPCRAVPLGLFQLCCMRHGAVHWQVNGCPTRTRRCTAHAATRTRWCGGVAWTTRSQSCSLRSHAALPSHAALASATTGSGGHAYCRYVVLQSQPFYIHPQTTPHLCM